jgi:hypothetical protein
VQLRIGTNDQECRRKKSAFALCCDDCSTQANNPDVIFTCCKLLLAWDLKNGMGATLYGTKRSVAEMHHVLMNRSYQHHQKIRPGVARLDYFMNSYRPAMACLI